MKTQVDNLRFYEAFFQQLTPLEQSLFSLRLAPRH